MSRGTENGGNRSLREASGLPFRGYEAEKRIRIRKREKRNKDERFGDVPGTACHVR